MRAALVAVALAGCGDNTACAVTSAELPGDGPFADPYALLAGQPCVDGGLDKVAGRWFVSDPTQIFAFGYPKFEGDCRSGVSRLGDLELSITGFHEYSWSDGTIYFFRELSEQTQPASIADVYASATCMLSDGSLVEVIASQQPPGDPVVSTRHGRRIGRRDTPALGLELVGELAGSEALNIVVDGSDAFLAGELGFDIVDISGAPRLEAHIAEPNGYNDVKILHRGSRRFAILAPFGGTSTLIVDVTDPSAPSTITTMPVYSHSIFLDDDPIAPRMYLADYSQGIPQYDVSDPAVPRRLAIAPVQGPDTGIHDLFVDGATVYVNDTQNGFIALDVSAGWSKPVELGRIKTSLSHGSWVGVAGGRKIILHGDEGMTGTADGGAFLRILDGDRSSPTYFQELARYQSRPQVGIHYFKQLGDRAYIAYYQDGVRVLDLSDPTKPREIAHYNTWDPDELSPGNAFEGALGVYLANGLIYVADLERGLLILRETL